jgi:hypothetical protein
MNVALRRDDLRALISLRLSSQHREAVRLSCGLSADITWSSVLGQTSRALGDIKMSIYDVAPGYFPHNPTSLVSECGNPIDCRNGAVWFEYDKARGAEL